MITPNFQALILEYQSEGVGEILYTFIWNIVLSATRRYPAAHYSSNGIWDEDAIGGLCHDFIIEKLLRTGLLEHYLIALETTEQLHRALQRDFRHFLINRRKKDEFQNLVRRVRQILNNNPNFANCNGSNQWGLYGWDSRTIVQKLEEVVQAMYKVVLPPVTRYKITSRKIDHLISTPDLERLLLNTLRDLDRCVDFGLIIQSLRFRMNVLDIQEFSMDEVLDIRDENSQSYVEVIPAAQEIAMIELVDIAQRIYSQLSTRQRHTLALYLSLEDATLEIASNRLGISKGTVKNDLNRVTEFIAAAELTEEEAQKLFEQLSELCADADREN